MLDTPIGTVKGRMRLGPGEAARPARRPGGGDAHERAATARATTRGAYVLRRAARRRARALRGAPGDVRGLPARRSPSCRSPPTRCRSRAVQVGPPPELKDRIMAVVALRGRAARAPPGARADEPAAAPRRASAAAAPAGAGRSRCARCRPRWPPASLVAAGVDRRRRRSPAATTRRTVTGDGADRRRPRRRARRSSSPTTRPSSRSATCRRRRAGKVYQVWLKRPNQDAGADDGALPHRRERQRRRRDPARAPEGRRAGARDRRARRRLACSRRAPPVIVASTA